jgi:hypothetical protein
MSLEQAFVAALDAGLHSDFEICFNDKVFSNFSAVSFSRATGF